MDVSPPRRWWKRLPTRLSVRASMALILLVGVGLGWIVNRARVQRHAIAVIEKAGGEFSFEEECDEDGRNTGLAAGTRPGWQRWIMGVLGDDFVRKPRALFLSSRQGGRIGEDTWQALSDLPDLVVIIFDGGDLDDSNLALLGRFTRLRSLDISGSDRITSAGFANLERLRLLHSLDLDSTRIDDAGLAHIAGLSLLQDLHLSQTQLTDAGLIHLRGLTELQDLFLGVTQVSDDGLSHLSGLPKLRTLWVENTRVTDRGLGHLAGMTSLENLLLSDTAIGDAGLKQLSKLDQIWGLHVENTKVSDASLPFLMRLSMLKNLTVAGSAVSQQGVQSLKAAYPSAKIR